jgi:hypothetical protein
MNTLQQQSPDVQRSNPRWVLKTVEPNLPNETCPISLPPLQPAQCPIEMWEIFMPHPQNGCFHNTLQQQSPDVQRSNPRWVLKTVEPNLPNETCPTSLPLLQPAQCPIEMWEIFMPCNTIIFRIHLNSYIVVRNIYTPKNI